MNGVAWSGSLNCGFVTNGGNHWLLCMWLYVTGSLADISINANQDPHNGDICDMYWT